MSQLSWHSKFLSKSKFHISRQTNEYISHPKSLIPNEDLLGQTKG